VLYNIIRKAAIPVPDGGDKNDLDKFSNAITEMLPQQINSQHNAYG
jgi:hypothetical protein